MPERRVAAVAIAFAVGILTAEALTFAGCLLLTTALVIAGLMLLPAQYRSALVLIAAVLLGGAARYAADRSIAANDISHYAQQVSAFQGRVVSDVESRGDSVRMTLRVDRAKLPGGWRRAGGDVMVSVYQDRASNMPQLAYGDCVRLDVRPYVPSEPGNPGEFSWKNYLARHGIYASASVRKPGQIVMLSKSGGASVRVFASAARNHLIESIRRIHPRKEASVICGVVLGTYAYLDEQTLANFTKTGTLHVLAASGFNCFVLVMIAVPVLMLLRVPVKYRSLITILLIGLYLLMVGPAPSLVRAATMSTLLLLAIPLRRVACYVNLLYAAALILLLFDPSNLFEVGFQLSFCAVLALVYVAPVIYAILARTHLHGDSGRTGWNRNFGLLRAMSVKLSAWLIGILSSAAVATTAVGLVTVPIIVHYFHYFSLTSLPANLVVALVAPLVFVDGLASAVTSLLPAAPEYAGFFGTMSARAMLWTTSYLGSMRCSSIAVQSPGALGILGYYLLLYAAGGYTRSRFVRK